MPSTDRERKKQTQLLYEQKRRKAYTRLRIALKVMQEYGCLWEYEQRCADEGIEDPLMVPDPQEKP